MSSSTFHHRRQRNRLKVAESGFTLVELLVVIAIIGILVGLLLVAGRSAIIRANEFAVTSEIIQMGQAVEEFQTKYGFYPPSSVDRANNFAQIKRILARIAPNHRHTDAELEMWHDMRGDAISEQNALVFWLGGGLSQNKQRPLDLGGNRETFYEFDSTRLLNTGAGPGSGGYEMEFGKSRGNRIFLYFGSTSYGDYGSADPFRPYTLNGANINPNTFQIYSAGIDADFGSGGASSGGDVASLEARARDNLTNFGDGGRLEVFLSN